MHGGGLPDLGYLAYLLNGIEVERLEPAAEGCDHNSQQQAHRSRDGGRQY